MIRFLKRLSYAIRLGYRGFIVGWSCFSDVEKFRNQPEIIPVHPSPSRRRRNNSDLSLN